MKTLDPGHQYELNSLDGDLQQVLTFVKRCDRDDPSKYPGNDNAYPGTTTQEVLRALINRTQYVQNQIPCLENEQIISMLRQCIYLLESRAKQRKGKALRLTTTVPIEAIGTCPKCGHILCTECAMTGIAK